MKSAAGLISGKVFSAVQRLVPERLKQNPILRLRAENLIFSSFLAVFVTIAYGFFYHALGDDRSASFCFLVGLVAVFVPLVIRAPGGLALSREILTTAVFLLLLALSYRLGGISAPTVIWFAVCPIIGMLTGGLRVGLAWSALGLIAVAGIYCAERIGVSLAPVMVTDMRLLQIVSTISLIATVALDLWLFEKSTSNLVDELNKAMQRIQDLAIKDELTGIHNRREILRLAEQERSRVARHGSSFCFCLIDLDHFKVINDTYGHGIGDLVLKQVAATVQQEIRQCDYFGRYGGEEFLLLLVETASHDAKAFVERIRKSIEDMALPEMERNPVTISIGIAEHFKEETIAQSISRADKALYQAKWEGRNCVVVAENGLAAASGAALSPTS